MATNSCMSKTWFKVEFLENGTLMCQAVTGGKEQFANSPGLKDVELNAIMDALRAFWTMSPRTPVWNVARSRRDILLGQQTRRKPPEQIRALRLKSTEPRILEILALHYRWRLPKVTKIVR